MLCRLALEERIASLESTNETVKHNPGFGAKELTFVPSVVSDGSEA